MFQNNLNPIPSQNSIQGFPSQPQSFPPQVPQQSYPPNMGNPMPQQKGFFSKMNSATDGFIQFIKSKTPMVSAQGLLNSPTLNLEPINKETFQELQTKNIKEVECGKITKTVLNDVTVISKIINPRTVEKGFFESNFVLYDIATEQFKWLVNRRYSDFHWLRDCLISLFPAESVPQLPKKKLGSRRFQQDFIVKRQKRLQVFLDKVLQRENFKSCEPLVTFLSCPDRIFFENQMKILNPRVLAPSSIGGIKTFDGKIKVIDFESGNYVSNNNLFNNINVFFKLQADALKQVHKSLTNFNESMATACASLEEVENSFQKLTLLSSRADFSKKITNAYEQYEIFFKNWKRILINQTCAVKETVSNYFKDISSQSLSYSELLEQQETLKNEYISRKGSLMAKKEKLWMTMDISKWEVNQMEQIDMVKIYRDKQYALDTMCFKDTAEVSNLADILGFYYARTSEQFWDIVKNFESSIINDLNEFSNLFEPSLTDSVNVWSNLASNINKE